MSNLPEWTEAICAIATLSLAIIIFFQNKKIKTLTDVVKSLNQQAKIAQELLSFEIKSRINLAQPNFTTGKPFESGNKTFILNLINRGIRAKNIELNIISNLKNIERQDNKNTSVENNNKFQVTFQLEDPTKFFEFKLNFEDDFSNSFEQVISGFCDKTKITISREIYNNA